MYGSVRLIECVIVYAQKLMTDPKKSWFLARSWGLYGVPGPF